LWSSQVAAQPSAADLETARALYKEGRTLREEGKMQEAREKLKAAHALGQTPITGLELARTHAALGEMVEAREVCLGIARIPVAPDETDRSVAARAEAAQLAETLKPRIPSLVIRVPAGQGQPPTVVVDGQPIPVAALGQLRKVNPGRHDVVATFSDGGQSRVMVEVREGETAEVGVALPPPGAPALAVTPQPYAPQPPSAVAPAPEPAPGSRRLPGYAWAGFSIATAGFVVGSVSGLLAIAKSKDLETACPNHQCPAQSHADLDNGKNWGTVSNVAFGSAAIGLVLGIAGAIAGSGKPATTSASMNPWIGPSSVGLKGAF
jgi:hypothetical protein